MIPLKLELKNFLSYGEAVQTIDLSNYSLICFSGKNGNGKSALLDAITWALWGQARKVSGNVKPDAGLLRLGQTQMLVSLEFEFSKQIYRVRREYAKTYGKPYASLDFEVFDDVAEKFVTLTDKTIRITQEKIETLLGLDYETFVNSAFLRQGLADEFSKKSSKERKQILTNILGLSRFDEYQSLANEKAKSFTDEKKVVAKLLEENVKQVEREKEIKDIQAKKNEELKETTKELVIFQKNLDAKEKQKNSFIEKKHKYDFLLKEKDGFQKRFEKIKVSLKKNVQEWKKIHYKSLLLPNLQNLQKQLLEFKKQEKEFLYQQQKSFSLQEDLLKQREIFQKRFGELKNKLEKQSREKYLSVEKKQLEIKQLQNLAEQNIKIKQDVEKKQKSSNSELLNLEKELKNYEKFELNLEKIKNQFEKRRSFYQVLVQKGNWIRSSINELEQKKEAIKDQESPACPLCEQVLTKARKNFLGTKFKKEYSFLNHRFKRVSELVKKLKDILILQHREFEKLQKEDEFYKKMILKKEELNKNLKLNEHEIQNIDKVLKDLILRESRSQAILNEEKKIYKEQENKIESQVLDMPEINELVLNIKSLEKDKIALKYDNNVHVELQKKINKLEQTLAEFEKIKDELSLQKQKRKHISDLVFELKDLKKKIFELDINIKKINFNKKDIEDIEKDALLIKKDIEVCNKKRENILQQIGSVESELKRIEQLKKDSEIKKERIKLLEVEIEEYQILTQAFGKNGIQALLIEDAIPQIEEEANNILARLTDNQAQVFIESLRDLKSGGVKETLDIQISDSAGIRPYEMFSGGEAFRVDFALRIAISKLLAQRAGTALQTLIIDEGFGSQDEEGLSRLMDAIYAIQKDFSKVIVVSHLTAFKDNFPVHFIIEKNTSGSFVKIEQRG